MSKCTNLLPTMNSYAAEVIADASGKWSGNAIRFHTEAEAKAYAVDLAMRWTLVTDRRVVQSPDMPNYSYVDGRLVAVNQAA